MVKNMVCLFPVLLLMNFFIQIIFLLFFFFFCSAKFYIESTCLKFLLRKPETKKCIQRLQNFNRSKHLSEKEKLRLVRKL
ncbi:hypothetical protein L2E82_20366 [Cichorium intybus]|uniref:Uncharacterized protein n=1 Tax=Cichorium intybus TaxID=13427 RepID=A0ACB9DTG9_CICIN|nr:hypothetical protein L2E82_20366 [Cichorium intybus]